MQSEDYKSFSFDFRIVLAFLIAPVTPGLLMASMTDGNPGFVVLSMLLGYPTAVLIGVPIYWFHIRKRRLFQFWRFLLYGFILGITSYFLISLPGVIGMVLSGEIIEAFQQLIGWSPFMWAGAIAGIVATSVFWIIAFVFRDMSPRT